jgi:beta-glucanase (GH16 family)
VEWDGESVKFSVDSAVHYSVARSDLLQYGSSVISQPYFVILNLAVGGQFDGDPGSDAIFPATMVVDWCVFIRSSAVAQPSPGAMRAHAVALCLPRPLRCSVSSAGAASRASCRRFAS